MIRTIKFLLLLGLMSLMGGACVDDTTARPEVDDEGAFLTLKLKVPGQRTVTRGLTDFQENELRHIQVLVFKELPSGEEVFDYVAPMGGLTEVGQLVSVTLRLKRSEGTERYRAVVLANATDVINGNVEGYRGVAKKGLLDQYTLDYSTGRWDTDAQNPTPLPMWGETPLVTVDETLSTAVLAVTMLRAVARVDVGVNVQYNAEGQPTGLADGLSHFTLQEVALYRASNKGKVVPEVAHLNESLVATRPSLPADVAPGVSGTVAYAAQGNLVSREIYLPETLNVGVTESKPCLIVKGVYGGQVGYYRLDFAMRRKLVGGTMQVSEFDILRNYRYVFNIVQVNGPGYNTPQEALKATVPGNIQVEVVTWDEHVHEMQYINGEWFGLDSRQVDLLPFKGQEHVVRFQSSLSDLTTADFEFFWSSGTSLEASRYGLVLDVVGRTVKLVARADNQVKDETYPDILLVKVRDFFFSIAVTQKFVNGYFKVVCDSTVVNGKYRVGTPLDASNSVSFKVVSMNNQSLEGFKYEFVAWPLEGNASNILFEPLTGTFTNEASVHGDGKEFRFTLPAVVQTPGAYGQYTFKLFNNGFYQDESCSFVVRTAMRSKRILSIGSFAHWYYGYTLEYESSSKIPGSRRFVDSKANFGIHSTSTVKMLGSPNATTGPSFQIMIMGSSNNTTSNMINGMSWDAPIYETLVTALASFKPDIILTGHAVSFRDAQVVGLLAEYVKERHVPLIMCNEYYPDNSQINLIKAIFNEPGKQYQLSYKFVNSGLAASHPLPTGSAWADDPICNGPFGDLRGRRWGEDGAGTFSVGGLPAHETVVYTTETKTGNNLAQMFRHAKYPFFFVGDGGFISSDYGKSSSTTYDNNSIPGFLPFSLERYHEWRPKAHVNYNRTGYDVYNSAIFGNVLAWAAWYAEEHVVY